MFPASANVVVVVICRLKKFLQKRTTKLINHSDIFQFGSSDDDTTPFTTPPAKKTRRTIDYSDSISPLPPPLPSLKKLTFKTPPVSSPSLSVSPLEDLDVFNRPPICKRRLAFNRGDASTCQTLVVHIIIIPSDTGALPIPPSTTPGTDTSSDPPADASPVSMSSNVHEFSLKEPDSKVKFTRFEFNAICIIL